MCSTAVELEGVAEFQGYVQQQQTLYSILYDLMPFTDFIFGNTYICMYIDTCGETVKFLLSSRSNGNFPSIACPFIVAYRKQRGSWDPSC